MELRKGRGRRLYFE